MPRHLYAIGNRPTTFRDLTGQRIGLWTVKSRAPNPAPDTTGWNCICDCGTERVVRAPSLIRAASGLPNSSQSCGCKRKQRPNYKNYRHLAKRYKLRKKYGLTLADVERMWQEQGRCCAICRQALVLSDGSRSVAVKIDHDHSNGEIRGLLCGHCNTGLGMFRDNPINLASAILYLDRSNPKLRLVG